MAVVTSATSANAGFHYVLLMDPDTFDPIAQYEAAAVDGVYRFAFSHVPAGSYVLLAGSDADNDFFICSPGEACGAYPTLGSQATLEITSDRTDLDFVTGFLQSISGAGAAAGNPAASGGVQRLRGKQLNP